MCTTSHIFYPYNNKRRTVSREEEELTLATKKKWRRNSHEKKREVVHKIGTCKLKSMEQYSLICTLLCMIFQKREYERA